MSTLNGIDVSAYQPHNIPQLVPGDFVVIKATEGTGYVSSACEPQVQSAIAAGKLWGVYHFASGGDAAKEAEFFAANVKGYVGKGILVLDFEAGALARGAGWARQFLDRVFALTGVRPILYVQGSQASQSQYKTVVDGNYGLWVANWGGNAAGGYRTPAKVSSGVWPFAVMHQYGSNGSLPGYAGRLDLDVFYGDRDTWMKYAASNGNVQTAPPVPPAAPAPAGHGGVPAPAFPLPSGSFFGPEGGPARSVSGYHSHRADLKRWQQRMKDRGWSILVDGLYGPRGATTPTGNTADITKAFQTEKHLLVDGKIGPKTWGAAWTEPIT